MMSPALATPGRNGTPLAMRGAGERVGQAGRDDEPRPGVDRASPSMRLVEHRPGADDRALDAGHGAHRVERAGRAQRDLDHRQAALDQRLGQRDRVDVLVDHQHRDDRRQRA